MAVGHGRRKIAAFDFRSVPVVRGQTYQEHEYVKRIMSVVEFSQHMLRWLSKSLKFEVMLYVKPDRSDS